MGRRTVDGLRSLIQTFSGDFGQVSRGKPDCPSAPADITFSSE
jgi:hypothetical protein